MIDRIARGRGEESAGVQITPSDSERINTRTSRYSILQSGPIRTIPTGDVGDDVAAGQTEVSACKQLGSTQQQRSHNPVLATLSVVIAKSSLQRKPTNTIPLRNVGCTNPTSHKEP